MFKKNLEKLKQDLNNNNIDLAVITDDDSIYYFTGYFDFLHMSFGRPTILLVPKDADTLLITPLIDAHLVKENCPVDKIITWNDGVDNEWREELPNYIKKNVNVAIEKFKISTLVLNYISYLYEKQSFKKPPFSVGFLDDLCLHCSEQEKTASKAERDSVKYMQVKFLKNKLGRIFLGVISGVTDWGLYVELEDNLCEGLIKISSLSDDHYIYNEKTHSLDGYRNKNSYQLGQTVKIKVVKADLEKKQLDFILL